MCDGNTDQKSLLGPSVEQEQLRASSKGQCSALTISVTGGTISKNVTYTAMKYVTTGHVSRQGLEIHFYYHGKCLR